MIVDMHARLKKALENGGDVYDLEHILFLIETGHMQSFADGDSWVITSVTDYPKKRVLHILYAIGNHGELDLLHDKVMEWAVAHDVELVVADGRDGWMPDAKKHGWKRSGARYMKEL